jgi:hypothetical protein
VPHRGPDPVVSSEVRVTCHAGYVTDATDARIAGHAVASLWSEYGFLDAPLAVLEMLTHAVEMGYVAALEEIRRGALDRDPGLAARLGL